MNIQDFHQLQEAYVNIYEKRRSEESGEDHPEVINGKDERRKKLERKKKDKEKYHEESVDYYDLVLSHLLDEGYADSEDNAEIIMVNMSEEWLDDIIEKADNTIRLVYGKGGSGIPVKGAPGLNLRRPKVGFLQQGKDFRSKNRENRERAWSSYAKREHDVGYRNSEREFSNAKQINRMNASAGYHPHTGDQEKPNDTFKSRYPFVDDPIHYKEVHTNRAARKRRAMGESADYNIFHADQRGVKKVKGSKSQWGYDKEGNPSGKYLELKHQKTEQQKHKDSEARHRANQYNYSSMEPTGWGHQRECFNVYDLVLSHLLDEGYADSEDNAEIIMVNMSEEWLDEIIEATAMAKRGYDEVEIRKRIAASTRGGEAADRATEFSNRPTFGHGNSSLRQRYAAKQRGDFRKTTSSSPGLHGIKLFYNPDVKAKQDARGSQRGVLTPNEKKKLGR